MANDYSIQIDTSSLWEGVRRNPACDKTTDDNEKDSIGSAPADEWRLAPAQPGRSTSDRIH
jgi:hypothetical protein